MIVEFVRQRWEGFDFDLRQGWSNGWNHWLSGIISLIESFWAGLDSIRDCQTNRNIRLQKLVDVVILVNVLAKEVFRIKIGEASMLTINNKEELLSQFRTAAATDSGRIHIIPIGRTWSIRRERAKRAIRVVDDKKIALNFARSIGPFTAIIVHDKDGTYKSYAK